MSSLGSRAGFSSSVRISISVISPIPSSSASFFLSLTLLARLLTAFCPELPEPEFVTIVSFSSAVISPPLSAAARAFPIAVSVLRITGFFGRGFFSFTGAGFFTAAFFWASFTSSIVSPSFSISFPAAS